MSLTICLAPSLTIDQAGGGGHLWVYLNWALGFRSLGCRVIWFEGVDPGSPAPEVQAKVAGLKQRLAPYGLAEGVALYSRTAEPLPAAAVAGCLHAEAAFDADLLLDIAYGSIPPRVVASFRRSALVDIDPGLTQTWLSAGKLHVPRHDAYFTIGETVGQPGARFPDAGLPWQYTPPCVALDWWPVAPTPAHAPFTTVSHWFSDEWMKDGEEVYDNSKRAGFLPFLDLPSHTRQPLELALRLAADPLDERTWLEQRGWRVREAADVASTPWDYQRYIQQSRGEFSCVKPSCIRLQNAWISDRTLCYLASGKPAVVQHTGPSRFLPDAAGLFRFQDVAEAAHCLEEAAADYERHARLARALAEEHFAAKKVAASVVERALA